MMRIWKEENGQVLVFTALSMTLLLGFMGMAVDVGSLFHDRRNQQTAVDAAALAGAMAYRYGRNVTNAAEAAATANGVPDPSTSLTVHTPPSTGPNMSKDGFVEAILTEPRSTIFMSLFGFHTVDVTTRAVAGTGGPAQGCLYVLDPTGKGAMQLQGSFSVTAPGCGVMVNSSDSCALQFTGGNGNNNGYLTAGWVAVNGGACGQSSDSTPLPQTYMNIPINDPLNGFMGPIPPDDCDVSPTITSITGTS